MVESAESAGARVGEWPLSEADLFDFLEGVEGFCHVVLVHESAAAVGHCGVFLVEVRLRGGFCPGVVGSPV